MFQNNDQPSGWGNTMQIRSELLTLQELTARLPFDLEDTEQANNAFARWRQEDRDDAKRIVELWTYCFVRRYYLQKFAREAGFQLSDYDDLVARTYRKIERHISTVHHDDRYVQWVSKICKNTFLNYARSPRRLVSFDVREHAIAGEPPIDWGQFDAFQAVLAGAVGRLPGFLQSVARLRFIEKRSYEEIERVTGKPLPVIRSYASKALTRFRKDTRLRAFAESLYEEVCSR